jgi:uncharacterized protein
MSVKGAIVETIGAEPDKVVRGRTLLQKKLYFISLLTGEDFGFSPYFYGPYSQVATDALGALVEAGFVEQEVDRLGDYDQFGEKRRYSYSLTEDARAVLEKANGEWAHYHRAAECINSYSLSRNMQLLAVASKVHVIQSSSDAVTVEDVRERARQYGWELNPNSVAQVTQFLTVIREAAPKTVTA